MKGRIRFLISNTIEICPDEISVLEVLFNYSFVFFIPEIYLLLFFAKMLEIKCYASKRTAHKY